MMLVLVIMLWLFGFALIGIGARYLLDSVMSRYNELDDSVMSAAFCIALAFIPIGIAVALTRAYL